MPDTARHFMYANLTITTLYRTDSIFTKMDSGGVFLIKLVEVASGKNRTQTQDQKSMLLLTMHMAMYYHL
jgi:hypothetical protein